MGVSEALLGYLSSQGGLQRPNRYNVTITRPGIKEASFLCSLAQIPSRIIRTFSDNLNGAGASIGVPYKSDIGSNLYEFVIEESWLSRKYFEDWQTSLFVNADGQISKYDVLAHRANYIDEVAGEIKITALSTQDLFGLGTKGDKLQLINASYVLQKCIPLEIIPTAFQMQEQNTSLKFMVNIFAANYLYQMGEGTGYLAVP